MMESWTRTTRAGVRIALLLAVALVWGLFFAPVERSMGTTIRPVYLHVAATVAGLTMLYAVAALGLLRTAGLLRGLDAWHRRVWGAGVVMFALGFCLSLMAAQVAWGGVFWAEPRVRASIGVVAVGMVTWAVSPRITGKAGGALLWPAALAIIVVMLAGAQRIIHPEDPVQDVTPWSIRGTFYAMTALMMLVGWNVVQMLSGDGEEKDGG